MTLEDIGLAMLISGIRIHRKSWPNGVFVMQSSPTVHQVGAFIQMGQKGKKVTVPFQYTMDDFLADDWELMP